MKHPFSKNSGQVSGQAKRKATITNSGVTLVELIVIIAIISLLSIIVIPHREDFRRSVEFDNISYQVALLVRQAQANRTGSVSADIGAADFDLMRGVYFEEDSREIITFIDDNEDGEFDSGETIQTSTLPPDFEVSDLCFTDESITDGECPGGDTDSVSDMVIFFQRPDPAAYFYEGGSEEDYARAAIILEFENATQAVVVQSTGYIFITH